jgi:hypothetical protein
MPSPYQTLRRVGAVVAIGLALFLIIRTACPSRSNDPVRFAVELGDTAPDVRHIRVDLWTGDAADVSIGFFESDYPSGATEPVRFSQPVPGDVTATVDVTLSSGTIAQYRFALSPSPGSEISLRAY